MRWLMLGVLTACQSEVPAVRGTLAHTSDAELYAKAHAVLEEAGIHELTWGVTPFLTSTGDASDRYKAMVSEVSERIDVPINVIAGADYADVESKLLSGAIDIAVMSPYAYVKAHAKDPEVRVVATHIANGTESYGAYILTRDDSGIETINDLKGRTFGFVDSRSSSGWLFPVSRMLDDDVNPLTEMEGRFYGSHARVIEAIVHGEVDAGATYRAALSAGRGRIPEAKNLKVIARTERIPYDAYVVRAQFPAEAILGLQKAISSVSTRDAVGRRALSPLGDINGFVRTDDAHYSGVRETEDRVRSILSQQGGTLPKPFPDKDAP